MVDDLSGYYTNCLESFRMEFSTDDIKKYPEVKKLAKYINRMGKKFIN